MFVKGIFMIDKYISFKDVLYYLLFFYILIRVFFSKCGWGWGVGGWGGGCLFYLILEDEEL